MSRYNHTTSVSSSTSSGSVSSRPRVPNAANGLPPRPSISSQHSARPSFDDASSTASASSRNQQVPPFPGAQPYTPPSQHQQDHARTPGRSGSGGSGSGRHRNPAATHMESSVTRLLVATKQLLEALNMWGQGKMSEVGVSDVYVKLGNDFNAAVAAFGAVRIDMSELMSVPDDLRVHLESALSEPPSTKVVDDYLPPIRAIIIRLLQGLKDKQAQWRRHLAEEKRRERERGATSEALSARRQQLPPRSTTPTPRGDEFSPPTTAVPEQHRYQLSEGRSPSAVPPPRMPSPVPPATVPTRAMSPQPPPVPSTTSSPSPRPMSPPPRRVKSPTPAQPPTAAQHFAPPPPPPPASPPAPPPVDRSLQALKKSDALERRASKRFSTYTMGKMTGSSSAVGLGISTGGAGAAAAEGGGGSGAARRTSRAFRSDRSAPPVPSVPALPPGTVKHSPKIEVRASPRLSIAREEPDDSLSPTDPPFVPPDGSSDDAAIPAPAPTITTTSAAAAAAAAAAQPPTSAPEVSSPSPRPPSGGPLTVYLTIGRQTKKASIEDPALLTLASLRMLFIDRFAYSSGMDDFPLIYLRDPRSGVEYELEDTGDVFEGCVLSLNIEPLDQVKQHFDLQISTLSQDLRDLKTVISSNSRRISLSPQAVVANGGGSLVPCAAVSPARPTERQFQAAAQKLKIDATAAAAAASSAGEAGEAAVLSPSLSADAGRIVSDLKTHFDSVQSLRRDLGVMRQIYVDFLSETKDSFARLRAQTSAVRELANTEVGGARAYIDEGKAHLDARSQDVLTKMEEIQDGVDDLKTDVIQRRTKPRPQVMKSLKEEFEKAREELEALEGQVETVKPMWKKTWAEELQNIVDEQGFLNHLEKLVADLKEDHKSSLEVFTQVEQVASMRSVPSARPHVPELRPVDPAAGGIDTVFLEIRNRQADPAKRLKAIEMAERAREKEVGSKKKDEFANELEGFVERKALKKTGGVDEVERLRRKKDELNLRNALGGGGATSPIPPPASPSPATPEPRSPSPVSPSLAGRPASLESARATSSPSGETERAREDDADVAPREEAAWEA